MEIRDLWRERREERYGGVVSSWEVRGRWSSRVREKACSALLSSRSVRDGFMLSDLWFEEKSEGDERDP